MITLENKIRTFAANEAQDISHGIFFSAISLADCLAAGTVTAEEAGKQLAELQSDLAEADAGQ